MGSWGFPEGREEKWEVELPGWVGGLGPLDWVAGCQGGLNRVGESRPGPLSSRPSLERYTEERLRELGLLVEGAGAAGKGLVPFPGSSRVGFGSQTHACGSL